MSKNKNMQRAKQAKNDEFYTKLSDIENELKHYRNHFKGKIVFLNCDDPTESNFWKYFSLNFEFLGLKKLISTHFNANEPTYKLELLKYGDEPIMTPLSMNGDFRSPECINILKECDIVVTNPPFSLFREYIALLVDNDKKFLVIGNKNAINYKNVFPLLKNNIVWLGITNPREFMRPNGEISNNMKGLTRWFTNLEHNKRNEEIILYREYNEIDYPKYDNYDAIEVSKVKDIPKDYYGVMGVPITFMSSYCPEQFRMLGITDRQNTFGFRNKKYTKNDSERFNDLNAGAVLFVNNEYKSKYARLLIQRKQQKEEIYGN